MTIEYGYRAAFLILRRYIRRWHKNTIRAIISTWAPPVENNTTKYVDFVAKEMAIDPDEVIKYEDKDTMVKLVATMQRMECGVPANLAAVVRGYEMT